MNDSGIKPYLRVDIPLQQWAKQSDEGRLDTIPKPTVLADAVDGYFDGVKGEVKAATSIDELFSSMPDDPASAAVAALQYFDVPTVMQSFAIVTLGQMKGVKAKAQHRALMHALSNRDHRRRGHGVVDIANTLLDDAFIVHDSSLASIAIALLVVAAENYQAYARDIESASLVKQAHVRMEAILVDAGSFADGDESVRTYSPELAQAVLHYVKAALEKLPEDPKGTPSGGGGQTLSIFRADMAPVFGCGVFTGLSAVPRAII